MARRSHAVAAAGFGLGASVLFAPTASADTFTVNSLDDPGDGTCDATDCTLREAVDVANADAAPDTITFASGLSGTIALDGDGLYLEAAVTVDGPGADLIAIDGMDDTGIFYVDTDTIGDPYDPVTISGLTLRRGYASQGGAVHSDTATLRLEGLALENNQAASAGGGAAWTNDGNLAIVDSTFTGNDAYGDGGGALYVANTQGTSSETDVEVLISGSRFTGNAAHASGFGDGGALYFNDPDGDIVIEDSTISGNESPDRGGGIYINEIAEGGDLTITGSTISGIAPPSVAAGRPSTPLRATS